MWIIDDVKLKKKTCLLSQSSFTYSWRDPGTDASSLLKTLQFSLILSSISLMTNLLLCRVGSTWTVFLIFFFYHLNIFFLRMKELCTFISLCCWESEMAALSWWVGSIKCSWKKCVHVCVIVSVCMPCQPDCFSCCVGDVE